MLYSRVAILRILPDQEVRSVQKRRTIARILIPWVCYVFCSFQNGIRRDGRGRALVICLSEGRNIGIGGEIISIVDRRNGSGVALIFRTAEHSGAKIEV